MLAHRFLLTFLSYHKERQNIMHISLLLRYTFHLNVHTWIVCCTSWNMFFIFITQWNNETWSGLRFCDWVRVCGLPFFCVWNYYRAQNQQVYLIFDILSTPGHLTRIFLTSNCLWKILADDEKRLFWTFPMHFNVIMQVNSANARSLWGKFPTGCFEKNCQKIKANVYCRINSKTRTDALNVAFSGTWP